jgi:hypothetical protein
VRGVSHEDPLSAFVKSEYHLASLILFTCDEHRHRFTIWPADPVAKQGRESILAEKGTGLMTAARK